MEQNIEGNRYDYVVEYSINGSISSEIPISDRADFLLFNKFSQEQIRFIDILLDEAKENGFVVKIGGSK